MKVIDTPPISNRPAKGTAILGDLADRGKIIQCKYLEEFIYHEGVMYQYCGVTDGMGVYKSVEELRELEAEQTNRGER